MALLSRDDVLLGDEQEKHAFRSLSLDTISVLRLGDRILKLRHSVPTASSVPATEDNAGDTIQVESPLSVEENTPKSPPKRTLGRPKKTDKTIHLNKSISHQSEASSAYVPDRDTPIPSTETHANEGGDAGTKPTPKRRGSPGAVTSRVKAAVSSAVNAVQGGLRNLRSKSKSPAKSGEPGSAAEERPKSRRSTRSHTPINYSLRPSRKPSNANQRPSTTAGGNLQASKNGEANGNAPSQRTNEIREDTHPSTASENTQNEALPGPNAANKHHEAHLQDENSKLQSIEARNNPIDTPGEGAATSKPTTEVRSAEASSISQEQKTKDYRKSPTGSYFLESANTRKSSSIVVFKSNELKDPNWLRDHKGSWQGPIGAAVAALIIEKEDTTRTPRRTKKEVKRHPLGKWPEEQAHRSVGATSRNVEGDPTPLESDPKEVQPPNPKETAPERRNGDIISLAGGGNVDTESNVAPGPKKRAYRKRNVGETAKKRKKGEDVEGDLIDPDEDGEPTAKRQKTTNTTKRKRLVEDDGHALSKSSGKRQKSNPPDRVEPSIATENQHLEVQEAEASFLEQTEALPSTGEISLKDLLARISANQNFPENVTAEAESLEAAPKKRGRPPKKTSSTRPASSGKSQSSKRSQLGGKGARSKAVHQPAENELRPPFQPQPLPIDPHLLQNLDGRHPGGESLGFSSLSATQPPINPPVGSSSSNNPEQIEHGAQIVHNAVPRHLHKGIDGSAGQSSYPFMHQNSHPGSQSGSSSIAHPTTDLGSDAMSQYATGFSNTPMSGLYAPQPQLPAYRSPYASPYAPVLPPTPDPNTSSTSNNINTGGAQLPGVLTSTPSVIPISNPALEPRFEHYNPESPVAETVPLAPPSPSVAPKVAKKPTKQEARTKSTSLGPPSPSEKPTEQKPSNKATSPEAKSLAPIPNKTRIRAGPKQKKTEIEAELAAAGLVSVIDGVASLAVRYEETVGNIILSKDNNVIEFFGKNQHPPENPMFAFLTSEMNGNPIISMKGSYPMELRIRFHEGNLPKTHCFQFATTKQGYEAAGEMRAKLVAAKITSQMLNGRTYTDSKDVEDSIQRPWHCTKCESRFRNINGLEYHVNKSQTGCNPNFDITSATPKRGRYARKKSKSTPKKQTGTEDQDVDLDDSDEDGRPRKRPRGRGRSSRTPGRIEDSSEEEPEFDMDGEEEEAEEEIEQGRDQDDDEQNDKSDGESASGDSDDSIFEWAQTVATNGLQPRRYSGTREAADEEPKSQRRVSITVPYPTVKKSQPVKRQISKAWKSDPRRKKKDTIIYRRLRCEAEFLNEFAKAMNHPHADHKSLIGDARKKPDPAISDEGLKRFEQMILGLVSDNGGMLPGDRSLHLAFVAAWLKEEAMPEDLPEFKFISTAVDQLVAAKKLLKFGIRINHWNTRTYFVGQGTDPDSREVKRLKQRIQKANPHTYLPTRFLPLEPWRTRTIKMLETQGSGNRKRSKFSVVDYDDDEKRLGDGSSSDDEMGSDEDQSIATSSRDDSHEMDSQGFFEDGFLREAESTPFPPRNRAPPSRLGTFVPVSGKRRRPGANESGIMERNHRTRLASVRLQAWAPAPASLPNTTTGAWDQIKSVAKEKPEVKIREENTRWEQYSPPRTNGWSMAFASLPDPKTGGWNQKPVKTIKRKPRLPEPITYLQAPDGSWSHRAFGHGVDPVFSRPARRAFDSQSSSFYHRSLQNGFRPIVYPTKNMQFLPSIPSKAFLQKNALSPQVGLEYELRQSIEPGQLPRKRRQKRKIVEALDDENPVIVSETPRVKRKYQRRESTRQRSTLSRVQSVMDEESSSDSTPEPENVRRSGRAVRKSMKSLNEIDLMTGIIEASVEAPVVQRKTRESKKNPGLTTLPTYFWFTGFDDEVTTKYERIQLSDPKVVSSDSEMVDGSWTCNESQFSLPTTFKVKWQDAFMVETLHYYELEDDMEIPEVVEPSTRSPKRRRRESWVSADQNTHQGVYETARPQTALPEDFERVLMDPKKASMTFGIEVSEHYIRTRSKQGKKKHTAAGFESRFLVAVVVLQTLTGGLEGLIDWVILSKLFPDYSIPFLKTSWGKLSKKKTARIDDLVAEFQSAFLPAYEKGEVAAIDYDHLMDYDWDELIKWAMENISPSEEYGPNSIALPTTRSELMRDYKLTESADTDPQNWRSTYFNSSQVPTHKRLAIACAIPSSLPISTSPPTSDPLALAKSWIRAIALTPESDWPNLQSLARTKLSSLGEPLIKRAVTALTKDKVLHKGRVSPGRSYDVTDAYLAPLKKAITQEQFVEAARYKEYLYEQFTNGHQKIRVDEAAEEGPVMCLTHLQASRRVKLVADGVPMNKMGLAENGSYDPRAIPKDKLRFGVDIVPNHSYLHSDAIPMLDMQPPGMGPEGELPLWMDIGGNIIWDMWRRVVVAVAQTVALRAGVTVGGLAKALGAVGEWEVKMIMEWGLTAGLFERVHPRIEGWTVGEWWWVVVGRVCV